MPRYIDAADDGFGMILIYAVQKAILLGTRPTKRVFDFVKPIVTRLGEETLDKVANDLKAVIKLADIGAPYIDRTVCYEFFSFVVDEQCRRRNRRRWRKGGKNK